MKNRVITEDKDTVLRDFKKTPGARGIRLLTLIAAVVYIALLCYFLFFKAGGLTQFEYVMLLCFSAVPVLFSLMAYVFPYMEYDRLKKSLTYEQQLAFVSEYEKSRDAYGIPGGVITDDRIVFFMGGIGVPLMRDIVWIYLSSMPGTGYESIAFLTRDKKFYLSVVPLKQSAAAFDRYALRIGEYSKELLVGDSEENEKIYTEKYEKKRKRRG